MATSGTSSSRRNDAVELRLLDNKDKTTHLYSAISEITIGKSPSCDLILSGRGVSRRHCVIERNEEEWLLRDLGSTNGTKVNETHIGGLNALSHPEPCRLAGGEILTIGETRVQFLLAQVQERTEVLVPIPQSPEIPTLRYEPHSNESIGMERATLAPSGASSQSNQTPGPNEPTCSTNSDVHPGISVSSDLPMEFRQYNLLKHIGEGGMGDVLLASERRNPDRLFAIKFLKPLANQNSSDRARFLREMSISMTLHHSSLAQCVECGEQEGQLFIVMHYYSGGNLAQFLQRAGRLTERRAIRLLAKLVDGLAYAHSKGVVHRDLKPSNILLQERGSRKYAPKISDFGLAKSFLNSGESGMTVDGAIGGTLGYMPKEQLTNFRYVLPQSDVWSLGAILYETLTNELPRHYVDGLDPICFILEAEVRPIETLLPEIDRRFAKFLRRCLAIDPKERFANGSEMKKSLFHVANQMGIPI